METTITRVSFPEKGLNNEEIMRQLREMQQDDVDWRAGRTWSMVYYVDEPHLDLLKEAHHLYFSENSINPLAFRSFLRMEQDLVRMAGDLLHHPQAVGTTTSGGTESIFMAVYTCREWARSNRPGIRQPEMVVPASIHPAFFKAAHIMNIRVRRVPLASDLRADAAAMERAVNRNTILMAASAPCYPFGVIDPIEALGAVARRHRLPFHVDGCVGAFMLPWVEELGYELPVWDFRVPGVTSISADLHKFAYGSKGASLILYRQMDYLQHQFYILPDWCGGVYASTAFSGTRSVGPVAAAWAAIHAQGREGYLAIARRIMAGTDRLKEGLAAIPGIEILGRPAMNLIAFATRRNKPDIFVIGDQLQEKGWMVDRQSDPPSLHLMIMSHNIDVLDDYLADVRRAVAYATDHPEASARGNAAIYGLMARLPFHGMIEQNVRKIFAGLYGAETDLGEAGSLQEPPAWQGRLNRLLAAWKRMWRR